MQLRRSAALGLFLLPLSVLACSESEDDGCGEGLVFENGACVVPEDAGGAANGGSSNTSAGTDGQGGTSANAEFGAVCATHTDCTGDTNYCADSPVDPMPYCTASGCDAEPTICPDGWTCFNVGQFAPGEPYVCSRPLQ